LSTPGFLNLFPVKHPRVIKESTRTPSKLTKSTRSFQSARLSFQFGQNSWQSQLLLFATTGKRYTAFFTMFLKLPTHRETAPLSMKKNTTELLHNRLQMIQYKKACFSLPTLTTHIFQIYW